MAEWKERDVVIPTVLNNGVGNAVGYPGGAFGFPMEVAKAIHDDNSPGKHGTINPHHRPDLNHTQPRVEIPENPQWNDADAIISFHARGHRAQMENLDLLRDGFDIRPTIAITRSVFQMPGITNAIREGRLKPDDKILSADGSTPVTDINIDPVWRLPEVAQRIGISIDTLRKELARITGIQELITRPDIELFLPPIDGPNIHIYGDPEKLRYASTPVVARSHDFCRDGDNYAMRCTCAPFKQFAIEQCIQTAQDGGIGVMVYHPEEGRNLGSVIKHLVYNKRETGPQGDNPEQYFEATRQVIGGEDARMHWSKPDPYLWLLAHKRIDRWFSESPHKMRQITAHDIRIVRNVALPDERIPELAKVEIGAKRTLGGYHGEHLTHAS